MSGIGPNHDKQFGHSMQKTNLDQSSVFGVPEQDAAAPFGRVSKGSLSLRTYRVIRDGLAAGSFEPEQRLILQEIADQIGTSITPVREACLRLVSEGALEYRSGRFAQVPAFTKERYLSVRLVRMPLEGLAAKLAAERATVDELQRIKEIQEAYRSLHLPEDRLLARQKNIEFHFMVYRASREDVLVSHIERLWVMMGPMLGRYFQDAIQSYRGDDAHDNVIDAIADRNGKNAEKAIVSDLMRGGDELLRLLDAQESTH
ncbi:GntR family transcriptional regulator [Ruegeria sp. 2012CJ41-6]|uniref:GntR family transcriptional regulator n=1 Tax=Ruegeria spongiae TaxID=2942209 RepID=A0ABT0Q2S8_9RHOB|nr:GntR family transcriptional regulator [Ruegeria spongiae]MCL6284174.1 GntR family transcriptional regulator [Ruegeria spongiae]